MLKALNQPGVVVKLAELFPKASTEGLSSVVTIGRGVNNAWIITESASVPQEQAFMLSRVHARLKVENGSLSLQDNDTINGTFLNSLKLPPKEWTVLTEGDIISFGCAAVYKEGDLRVKNPWAFRIQHLAEFLASFVVPGTMRRTVPPNFALPNAEEAAAAQRERYTFQNRQEQLVDEIPDSDGDKYQLAGTAAGPGGQPLQRDVAAQLNRHGGNRDQREYPVFWDGEREVLDLAQFSQDAVANVKREPVARAPPPSGQDFIDLTGDSDEEQPRPAASPRARVPERAPIVNHGAHQKRRAAQLNDHFDDSRAAKRRQTDPDAAGPSVPHEANADHRDATAGIESFHREFTCAICQETIVCCHAMVPCGHNYCGECLAGWLVNKSDCPTCRQKGTAPPIRQNAIDNAIDALAAQLPEDERELRKEKKTSWETKRKDLEQKLKAPWQSNQGNRGANARRLPGGLMVTQAHVGMFEGILHQFGLPVPGYDAGYGSGNAHRERARRHASARPAQPPTIPQRQQYCVRYITQTSPVRCSACNTMSLPNELRIGMRTEPSTVQQQDERRNPYSWYHLSCFPASRWSDASLRGVRNVNNLGPADLSRVREYMRHR